MFLYVVVHVIVLVAVVAVNVAAAVVVFDRSCFFAQNYSSCISN